MAVIKASILSLMVAIHAVESHRGFDKSANGNEYQITSVCVKDVNRIYKLHYEYPKDVRDNDTAADIVMLYLLYYGHQYIKDYGKIPTEEVLAKIYNRGYSGFRRGDGNEYWAKIKKEKARRNAK